MKKAIFVMLMLFSFNVYADSCSNDELARLREIANNMEVSYNLENDDDSYPRFSITVNNLNKEVKALIIEDWYANKYKEFKNDGTNKGVLTSFLPGESIKITMKAYVSNACSGKTVSTKTVKLPYYNVYYNYPECKMYPNLKSCVKLTDKKITEEAFNKEINDFINANSKEETIVTEDNNGTTDWLLIIGITVGSILIISLIIIVISKKIKKNRI